MNYRPVLDQKLKDLACQHRDHSLSSTLFMLMRVAKGPSFSKEDLLSTTDEELLDAVAQVERELQKEELIHKIDLAEESYDDESTPEDLKERVFTDIEELEATLEKINKQIVEWKTTKEKQSQKN